MVGVFCLLVLPAVALTQLSQRDQRFGDPSVGWPGGGDRPSSVVLRMGKGFNSAKQVELAKKLQQAKIQQKSTASDARTQHDNVESGHNDEQLKMREEFGRLLAKNLPRQDEPLQRTSSILPNPKRSPNANKNAGPKLKARNLKKRKKQEEIRNSIPENVSEETVLQVGDKARRVDFESLVQVDSLQPLGPIEAAKLVPWVPPYLKECLVILTDPRRHSNDLRATIQYLNLPALSNKVQVIAVSADNPGELRAWSTRAQLSSQIPVFVDPSLDWMRKYGCIDSDRWSTHIIVVNSDGIIVQHLKKISPSHATKILTRALSK